MSKKINNECTWSFAGPWYWEFDQMDTTPQTLKGKLMFLDKYGLNAMGMPFATLESLSAEELEDISVYMKEHNLTFHPMLHVNLYKMSVSDMEKYADEFMATLEKYKDLYQCKITTSGLTGDRFDRKMPMDEKLDYFAERLQYVAKKCKEADYPLSLENHGDYYVSEYVELCKKVEGLYIFLDTGNTYLIGEKPHDAFVAAAPYVMGTHMKDHYVRPNGGRLSFDIIGAPFGQGDVGLRDAYDILKANCPNFDRIVMETEYVAATDNGFMPAGENDFIKIREDEIVLGWKDSVDFINSL